MLIIRVVGYCVVFFDLIAQYDKGQAVWANPQKTVLFLLRICYRTHNMLGIYYHTGDGTELLTS